MEMLLPVPKHSH